MTTNTLSLKELHEEIEDVERESELFDSIDTFTVDSITRLHENQEHAALKVVEQRAMQSNRLVEGEGISVKERGIIKLHYEKFFGRMLELAKQGKNLVFIAEKKDKNENKKDAIGNQITVKVGEMPNMQKNAEYDFDVVIKTFIKDGESHGLVEKDRTGTFKPGEVIYKPNYTHWAEAIAQAQSGRQRKKEEIKKFDAAIDKEAEHHSISSGDRIGQIILEIENIINSHTVNKQKEIADEFTKQFSTIKFKEIKDLDKLQKMLIVAKKVS